MIKKPCCTAAFRTSIGGQALIEGILMRGPGKQAIVVRTPDGFVVREEKIRLTRERYPILGLPLLRGVVTFMDSIVRGVRALMFSADYLPDDAQTESSRLDRWVKCHFSGEIAQKIATTLAVVLSLALSVLLFFLLPTFLAGWIAPYIQGATIHNAVESLLKLVIFFAYMLLVSKQRDVQRVFRYHGAEHKTIFCYEAGLPLTVENCRVQNRFHPRCGTSFLFVVMIVSILLSSLVFHFVVWRSLWVRFAVHLLLLLPVIGVAYEFNRYVGRNDNLLTRTLSRPGLWLQRFTTAEPDDAMLEVAIRAIELVIPKKNGEDAW